jgi:hypothetical protein
MLFRKTRTLPFCYTAIRRSAVYRLPNDSASLERRHQRQNLRGKRIARSISYGLEAGLRGVPPPALAFATGGPDASLDDCPPARR